MNDIDLWHEADICVRKNNNIDIQSIGNELFQLYDIAYNQGSSNPILNKIVEYNTWNIYDDIWNGMTFKESITKYKEA
tara:strand:- start:1535 stop:1768 length:234 start_codon:yes stop_codon:yes gene_type:complete